MTKKDKYDFNSIINIKSLFSNNKFTINQCCRKWKNENREAVLEYHRNYNKKNETWKNLAGDCPVCDNRHYVNISIHRNTDKHKLNLAKLKSHSNL